MNQKNCFSNRWALMILLILFFPAGILAQYDIYSYDVNKKITTKLTNLSGESAFNVTWSNNGKKIAYDVVGPSASPYSQSIFITNLATNISVPLIGAEGGNDPAWSPDGEKIAFDDFHVFPHSIYSVSSNGGVRSVLRYNAHHASWNPEGNKIAFDDNNGYIGTKDINTGNETFVTYYGSRPSWSPNGKYIAFDGIWWAGGGIWVVEVDTIGYAIGWPVQLTTSGSGATWKNNSKEIVFADWPNGEPDIYSVPVIGGTATKICGREGGFDKGDYDPAFSNNGKFIAWSSYTDPVFTEAGKANTENNILKKSSESNIVLEQNFPNPFNNTTRINFKIANASKVTIAVTDLLGRRIKVLTDKEYQAGSYSINWDGRDANNSQVANGFYLYELRTNDKLQVKRMSVFR